MAPKFGTSGLRGLAAELIGPVSYSFARAFVQHLLDQKHAKHGDTIFVAWDYRESSPQIAASVTAAVEDMGLSCGLCGALPTPVLAFFAMSKGAASIMVTGSHIPADRNGLKFYLPNGEISKQDELRISQLVREKSYKVIAKRSPHAPSHSLFDEAIALFRRRLHTITRSKPLKDWSVGVYQHSTVARDTLVEVLEEAGANCIALGRSESFVPVDTEALPVCTAEKLKTWSRTYKLDTIVSADGDGDRPLIADSTGDLIRGDLIGSLTARFIGARHIATPVTSNSGIEGALQAHVTRTRVGSPFVIEAMQDILRNGGEGVAGFEANGGFLTMSSFMLDDETIDALPTRDCFLPILAVLAYARREHKSLQELVAQIDMPVALAGRLEDFAVERSAAFMRQLDASRDALSDFMAFAGDVKDVSIVDGTRVTLQSEEVVHFRPSGNAPEFRCYVEARSQPRAEELLRASLQAVCNWTV